MRAEVGRTLDALLDGAQPRLALIAGSEPVGRRHARPGAGWAARRDSFCAYMRTSASCSAAEGSPASAGIVAAPQDEPTSTPRSLCGQGFGGARGRPRRSAPRRR